MQKVEHYENTEKVFKEIKIIEHATNVSLPKCNLSPNNSCICPSGNKSVFSCPTIVFGMTGTGVQGNTEGTCILGTPTWTCS